MDIKKQEAYDQEVLQLAIQSEKDFAEGESKLDNTASKNAENAADGSKNVNIDKRPPAANPKTPQKSKNDQSKQR